MVATSASDRLRSGVASATPDRRDRTRGRPREPTSAAVASRGIKTHGRIVMWHLGNESRHHGLVGGARPRGRPARPVWRHTVHARPAGCCRHLVRPLGDRAGVDGHDRCGGGMADAAPLKHRTQRERPRGRVRRGPVGTAAHSDPSFAAGFSTVRGGVLQPPSAVVVEGADQTAWRQRPQRCGAAADEDQTFEGSALRGSGPTPSPSGTEPSCHPPGNFGFRRLVDVKRSEPHVRYRDATSPDPAVRRKPSRW